MKIYGAQHQAFDGILRYYQTAQPPVGKFIDPDDNILREVKRVSPRTTTIVRVYTGSPTVDDAGQHPNAEQYGRNYADLVYSRVRDPSHMDYLESENEPNDHYGNLTEFIKRLNAFLVGFSGRAKELGFRPLGPNFSTGYPEVYIPGSDYELWPNAWQGLTDGLRALRDANGGLALHEYDAPDLFRLWSDSRQRGYLVGRHKAVYRSLPADLLQLPLYITEFGIDFLVHNVEGGYWHNRDENAPTWMVDQMRECWTRIYSSTPQLKGVCFFLWGRNSPLWEEYDIARTDTSATLFTQFFSEELPGINPEPQPMPFAFEVYPLPSVARISQEFGVNPDYYRQFGLPGHEGIDLAVPIGMPVLSVSAGTIASASSTGNYGRHVRVTHADGWQTLYAHLSAIAAQVGQSVDAGDVLGNSGSSGNTTGPHLHFGLKHLGFAYTSPNGTVWPFNIFDATAFLEAVAVTGGEIMRTAGQRVAAGVRSIGVDYLADSALFAKARGLGLKYPLGQEYRDRITGEPVIAGQAFGPDGVLLETIEGQWGMDQIKAFALLTGEPWTKPVDGGGGTLPVAKRLTTADVSQYGFRVEPYAPQPGESFFGLIAIGNIQSGPQVGTTSTMNAFNQVGGAAIGYKLTHAYDVANHKFEKHDSPTVGVVLGPGSYIPPSASDRFYVSADDGQQGGSWPTPKGDVLVAGMPNGNHWQATYTWMLMTG